MKLSWLAAEDWTNRLVAMLHSSMRSASYQVLGMLKSKAASTLSILRTPFLFPLTLLPRDTIPNWNIKFTERAKKCRNPTHLSAELVGMLHLT